MKSYYFLADNSVLKFANTKIFQEKVLLDISMKTMILFPLQSNPSNVNCRYIQYYTFVFINV